MRRLKSWLDGREVALAETTEQVPALGASLDAGRVSGEHVDVLTRVLRQLEPAIRDQFVAEAATLVPVAEHTAADEFARTVREHTHRLERDRDGLDRLERQKRAIRCNTWTDKVTGMGRWAATWDPATMVRLETRLDTQLEAMFHDTQPEGCPTDPIEKQSYLRALALLALLDGDSVGVGRPEIIVVEDHTHPHTDRRPSVDWGLDIDLPDQYLDTLRPTARVYPITVRNGIIIEAPGQLNLGRTTRLANRAQRRALRGLYPTCAIPDCCVRYSRTKLHHVHWWRHGGLTDLDNLLPVCIVHHQKIHHHGWQLTLTPDRQLTIHYPDGNTMTTGPP